MWNLWMQSLSIQRIRDVWIRPLHLEQEPRWGPFFAERLSVGVGWSVADEGGDPAGCVPELSVGLRSSWSSSVVGRVFWDKHVGSVGSLWYLHLHFGVFFRVLRRRLPVMPLQLPCRWHLLTQSSHLRGPRPRKDRGWPQHGSSHLSGFGGSPVTLTGLRSA